MATQAAQAPDFTLDHVLGHTVSLSTFRGKKVAVVFGTRDSSQQLREGVLTIRRGVGQDQVGVISILDLRAIPRAARIAIKGKLKKNYQESLAEAQSQGISGEMNMCVDWSGKTTDAYSIHAEQQAVGVAINEAGQILGYGAGEHLGTQLLTALGQ